MTTIYGGPIDAGDIALTTSAVGSAEPTVTTDSAVTVQFKISIGSSPDGVVLKRLGAATTSAVISGTARLGDRNRIGAATSAIAVSVVGTIHRDVNVLEPAPLGVTISSAARLSGVTNVDQYFTLQADVRGTAQLDTGGLPVITRAQPWWDHDYLYRRVLEFTVSPTGLPEDHIVTVHVPKNIYYQGKTRGDYEDIEVLYLETVVPENWVKLGRLITEEEYTLKIDTAIPVDLDGNSFNSRRLFVYYGNPRLTDVTSRPAYTLDEYPLTAAYDSKYVTYTRNWNDGTSDTPREKAVFVFYGPHAKVQCYVGTEEGIAEFQIDNGAWTSVDLYRHEETHQEVVFSTGELGEGRHQLRTRVTGQKNPASKNTRVRIAEFNYRNHSVWEDIKEEHDETLLWGGSMVGV